MCFCTHSSKQRHRHRYRRQHRPTPSPILTHALWHCAYSCVVCIDPSRHDFASLILLSLHRIVFIVAFSAALLIDNGIDANPEHKTKENEGNERRKGENVNASTEGNCGKKTNEQIYIYISFSDRCCYVCWRKLFVRDYHWCMPSQGAHVCVCVWLCDYFGSCASRDFISAHWIEAWRLKNQLNYGYRRIKMPQLK